MSQTTNVQRSNRRRMRTRQTRIPRNVRSNYDTNIVPNRKVYRLSYFKHLNAAVMGFTSFVIRFRPTSAFDVDPVLASTAMSGFAELALLYEKYRLMSSSIQVKFINLETASGASVGIIPTNVDYGTSANPTALYSNPKAHISAVGAAGGMSVTTVRHSSTTAQITGNANTTISDNYTSIVTGLPGDNWYWFVFGSLPVGTFATGVEVQVSIRADVLFTSPQAPSL